ncbi:MAG TPA: rhomboid family intramembrane serine protease [Methylomirabilota bacterium]
MAYTIGPGPWSPAVKAIIIANVAMFVVSLLVPGIVQFFGLRPSAILTWGAVWQPVTYMFLHAGVFHILFNMLALWMFGVELERMWGTRFFVRYYAVTGVGAALLTMGVSLLPFGFADRMYQSLTIGASGAVYGLLLAYGLYFPNRPIYLYFLFQIPAKYFVMIVGAVAFLSSVSSPGGGVAHIAHLGGLLVGYVYLKGWRLGATSLVAEVKYRYLKWKINRMRKRFDVYPGGRSDDRDQRVH